MLLFGLHFELAKSQVRRLWISAFIAQRSCELADGKKMTKKHEKENICQGKGCKMLKLLENRVMGKNMLQHGEVASCFWHTFLGRTHVASCLFLPRCFCPFRLEAGNQPSNYVYLAPGLCGQKWLENKYFLPCRKSVLNTVFDSPRSGLPKLGVFACRTGFKPRNKCV